MAQVAVSGPQTSDPTGIGFTVIFQDHILVKQDCSRVYLTFRVITDHLSALLEILMSCSKSKVNTDTTLCNWDYHTAMWNHNAIWDHTVLNATQQRWLSRLYPAEAGTRFSDCRGMHGWVDLGGVDDSVNSILYVYSGKILLKCSL